MAKPEFFFGVVLEASECRSVNIAVNGRFIGCVYPEAKKKNSLICWKQTNTVAFPCCHGTVMSLK